MLCTADIADVVAFGAGRVSSKSIQIEMAQTGNNELRRKQINNTALLVQWLCQRFNIPWRMCWPYHERPIPRSSRVVVAGVA